MELINLKIEKLTPRHFSQKADVGVAFVPMLADLVQWVFKAMWTDNYFNQFFWAFSNFFEERGKANSAENKIIISMLSNWAFQLSKHWTFLISPQQVHAVFHPVGRGRVENDHDATARVGLRCWSAGTFPRSRVVLHSRFFNHCWPGNLVHNLDVSPIRQTYRRTLRKIIQKSVAHYIFHHISLQYNVSQCIWYVYGE